MRKLSFILTAIAVACFFSLPAMAQGRGGGMSGGAGAAGGAGMGQSHGMGQGQMPGQAGGMGNRGGQPGMQPGMGNSPGMGRMTQPGPSTRRSSLSKNSPTTLLAQNTKLSSKFQTLLPSGTNVQDAAKGFKNLGLFVAAVHVSHNLDIPFDQLKTTMLSNGDNLGKSIQTLNPKISKKQSKADAKKAEKQASKDIKEARNS